MKFYIAADYARRDEVRELSARVAELTGWEDAADWHTAQPKYKDDGLGGELPPDDAGKAAQVAVDDLRDVESAEVFIQLTTGDKARGGRHVELGYALAHDTWFVIVCGPREHAFHYHPRVLHIQLGGLLTLVRGIEAGRK